MPNYKRGRMGPDKYVDYLMENDERKLRLEQIESIRETVFGPAVDKTQEDKDRLQRQNEFATRVLDGSMTYSRAKADYVNKHEKVNFDSLATKSDSQLNIGFAIRQRFGQGTSVDDSALTNKIENIRRQPCMYTSACKEMGMEPTSSKAKILANKPEYLASFDKGDEEVCRNMAAELEANPERLRNYLAVAAKEEIQDLRASDKWIKANGGKLDEAKKYDEAVRHGDEPVRYMSKESQQMFYQAIMDYMKESSLSPKHSHPLFDMPNRFTADQEAELLCGSDKWYAEDFEKAYDAEFHQNGPLFKYKIGRTGRMRLDEKLVPMTKDQYPKERSYFQGKGQEKRVPRSLSDIKPNPDSVMKKQEVEAMPKTLSDIKPNPNNGMPFAQTRQRIEDKPRAEIHSKRELPKGAESIEAQSKDYGKEM